MDDEQNWSSNDPEEMLARLPEGFSERKLRLFAVLCCRLAWPVMSNIDWIQAIGASERYADGQVDKVTVSLAQGKLLDLSWNLSVFHSCMSFDDMPSVVMAAMVAERAQEECKDKIDAMKAKQASLLRHIIGNPFRPHSAPASWPSTVVQLAASLYEGQDCRLPLSDAMEESGHGELAEHFRAESWHMKGCFAIDLILGKA